jgi:hypothetical protein
VRAALLGTLAASRKIRRELYESYRHFLAAFRSTLRHSGEGAGGGTNPLS